MCRVPLPNGMQKRRPPPPPKTSIVIPCISMSFEFSTFDTFETTFRAFANPHNQMRFNYDYEDAKARGESWVTLTASPVGVHEERLPPFDLCVCDYVDLMDEMSTLVDNMGPFIRHRLMQKAVEDARSHAINPMDMLLQKSCEAETYTYVEMYTALITRAENNGIEQTIRDLAMEEQNMATALMEEHERREAEAEADATL
jgi:hypothetical protein